MTLCSWLGYKTSNSFSYILTMDIFFNSCSGVLRLISLAWHALPTARASSLLISAFLVHSTSFSPKPLQTMTAKCRGSVKRLWLDELSFALKTETVDWALKTNYRSTYTCLTHKTVLSHHTMSKSWKISCVWSCPCTYVLYLPHKYYAETWS